MAPGPRLPGWIPLRVTFAMLCLALAAAPAAGQLRGVYLPLDHPAHDVAELLVARGVLAPSQAMQRPFLLDDLRQAVARARHRPAGRPGPAGDRRDGGADPAPHLAPADRDRLDWLARVLGQPPEAAGWVISVAPEVGLTAASTAVPQLFLAAGDSTPAPTARLRIGAEFGPAAIQFEPQRLRDGDTRIPVALARVGWDWGFVQWGELERNWGPPEIPGLLLSPYGGTRPEFSFGLGPRVLRFEYRSAPLDDGLDSRTGERAGRTWAMHRLRWRPSPRLELAAWETTVVSEPGGADEARSSPFVPFSFPFQLGRTDRRNVTVGVDAAWQTTPGLRLEGQLLIDDIVLRNRDDADNPYPQRFGFTVQARGRGGLLPAWRAYATALSGLALNTFRPEEVFLDDGVGLGRLRPDHWEAGGLVTLAWGARPFPAAGPGSARAPRSGLAGSDGAPPDMTSSWPGTGLAEIGVKWRRQGARRFTDPFPDLERDPATPRFPTFSPEIEQETWALSGRLSWMPGPLTLRAEGQLQHRRFPASGAASEWGTEGIVELVWRIGRWSWAGTD